MIRHLVTTALERQMVILCVPIAVILLIVVVTFVMPVMTRPALCMVSDHDVPTHA